MNHSAPHSIMLDRLAEIDSVLFVFSTQRAIRSFYATFSSGLMPRALSIHELFSRAFYTPHKQKASSSMYKLLLHGILRDLLAQKPSITNLFVFEKSFLGYLQGSEFILPFFRELAHHRVPIRAIPARDVYADYEEHIAILDEIYTRFMYKLESLGRAWVDSTHKIITGFVKKFSRIEIYLDGFISPLEQELLYELSSMTSVHIHIRTDCYNATYFPWLCEELQERYCYTFALDSTPQEASTLMPLMQEAMQNTSAHTSAFCAPYRARLLNKSPLPTPPPILALSFELRISQCSFVLEKVRELLADGVNGDDILIITPDEGFSAYISLLDSARNCNYAMGKKLSQSPPHKAWRDALYALLHDMACDKKKDLYNKRAQEHSKQGGDKHLALFESIFRYIFARDSIRNKPQHNDAKSTTAQALHTLTTQQESNKPSLDDINARLMDKRDSNLYDDLSVPSNDICALLDALPSCPLSARLQQDVLEVLDDYRALASELSSYSYEDMLELVFLHIDNMRIDDVYGGQVRVMGILETRGLMCDYAIVVDCNASFIPRIADSDVFLNTAIRTQLAMPTLNDRENLQKHYYYQLFAHTRKGVFLTFSHNDEEREPSLLDELQLQGVSIERKNGDMLYSLFPQRAPKPYIEEEILGGGVDMCFSPSSLWVFMECRRKFYYRYITRLQELESFSDAMNDAMLDSFALGSIVHRALEKSFAPWKSRYIGLNEIKQIEDKCFLYLHEELAGNAMEMFAYEMLRKDLEGFFAQERVFGKEGYYLLASEQAFKAEIMIKGARYTLQGQIDRIDRRHDGSLRVIDYKFMAHDALRQALKHDKYAMQLAFYRLALASNTLNLHGLDMLGDKQNFKTSANGGLQEMRADVALIAQESRSAEGIEKENLAKCVADVAKGANIDWLQDINKQTHIEVMLYFLKESASRLYVLSDEECLKQQSIITQELVQSRQAMRFDKTLDVHRCKYCAYVDMCHR